MCGANGKYDNAASTFPIIDAVHSVPKAIGDLICCTLGGVPLLALGLGGLAFEGPGIAWFVMLALGCFLAWGAFNSLRRLLDTGVQVQVDKSGVHDHRTKCAVTWDQIAAVSWGRQWRGMRVTLAWVRLELRQGAPLDIYVTDLNVSPALLADTIANGLNKYAANPRTRAQPQFELPPLSWSYGSST